MKQIKIKIVMNETELQKEMQALHFDNYDLKQLKLVHQALSTHTIYACYETLQRLENTDNYDYVMSVTMGADVDELLDDYTNRDELGLSYICHCLCMLFLQKAYAKAIAALEVQEKIKITSFSFAGDDNNCSDLKELLAQLPGCGIKCNDQMMLIPSKSVIMLLKGTQDTACPSIHNTNSCAFCKKPCQFYHTD